MKRSGSGEEGESASRLIDKKIGELDDWRGVTLGRVRALIKEADPDVVEEWKWRTPVWSHDGIVCTGEAYKRVVKMTFAKESVEDKVNQMDRFELEEPSSADIAFLEEQLYDFNVGATGINDGQLLGVFVRDASMNMVAGAAGHTWGGMCELRQVWVAAAVRRSGLGRRLMVEVEAEAVRRGCRQLVLTTHSFQAPAFYQKLGFEIVAELPDYPRGHSQLLLRKQL